MALSLVDNAANTKILAIDDSEEVRSQINEFFKKNGFQVQLAPDGQSGLKVLETEKDISLVILDFNMPGMNGLETLEAIRTQLNLKDLPIVFLTTEDSEEKRKIAKSFGVKFWLVKPFLEQKVMKIVKILINDPSFAQ